MESGETESKRATVFGEALKETRIWENGRTQEQMAMEFISGRMAIGMKENGVIASSTGRAQISS